MNSTAKWLLAALFVLVVMGTDAPRAAETAAAPPPAGLSEEQFNQLVDALSQAVVKKLDAEGRTGSGKGQAAGQASRQASRQAAGQPAGQAAAKGDAAAEDEQEQEFNAEITAFKTRAASILSAFPAFLGEVAGIPGRLDLSAEGGRGLTGFLALLAGAIAAALGAEALVRRLLPMRKRLAARAGSISRTGFDRGSGASLLGLAAIDALAVAAVWLVGYVAIGAWFSAADVQSRFAAGVLTGLLDWRLYMLAFRLVLRPDLADARLAVMGDGDAEVVYKRISVVILIIIVIRIVLKALIAIKAPHNAIAAGQIAANLVILALFLWAIRASREAMAGWFESLARPAGLSLGRLLARQWHVAATGFFLIVAVTQMYGAVAARYTVPAAMILTLNVIIALVFLETILAKVLRVPDVAPPADRPGAPRFGDVFARCIKVAAFIGALEIVAQTWIVKVLALVQEPGWTNLARASITSGLTLFIAFIAWEMVKFATARYVAKHRGAGGMPLDDDAQPGGGSRLATLMPLLRVVLTIAIAVLALLIVLSELGVNIAPLIAGASVFGLAISFGSQTLVRDIVSGVFYLSDDAFRVGEYIDCGKAKGTVEGFTLRSIKLRHQNGQIHTIPFGQLGQVTNFSRDWTTVKFNLRFARDTDLEKLRRTVKKIGAELLADPDLKDEFLQPLKMQGVADITDYALVVRFKFTVKPQKPTLVQRQAIKRMVSTFAANGIEFASGTVAVQTVSGPADRATAGAAAATVAARTQAQAAEAAAASAG